jgi:plastocyanin
MQRLLISAVLLGLTAASVAGAELSGTAQVAGKPAAYAVIWLDVQGQTPLTQSASVAPVAPVAIDQRNLAFWPHVLAVRVGTPVDFPNNDRVFHNVFSFKDGKKFDLGMYPAGVKVKPVVFDKPGLSRIFCNIHPNMAAYVMAVESPYYVVADERGAFTISGVPPGTYTYHAWRPGGETLTGSVTVGMNKPLEIGW